MSDWLDRSLADLYRLLVALEAAGGDAFIQGLIDRVQLPADFAHPRVTVRSLLHLLNQTDGSTILPEQVETLLKQLDHVPRVRDGITVVEPYLMLLPTQPPAEIVDMNPVIGQVTVNYELPINQLFRFEGSVIEWVHNKITDVILPARTFPSPQGVPIGIAKFNRRVSSHEALAAMTDRGRRPINIRELIAVLQKSRFSGVTPAGFGGSFVALGSHIVDGVNGFRYPYANYGGPNGRLQLWLCKHGETPLEWEPNDRFLYSSQPIAMRT